MTSNINQALNNVWVVVRAAKMSGDEHDQLKADFASIQQALSKDAEDKKKDKKK